MSKTPISSGTPAAWFWKTILRRPEWIMGWLITLAAAWLHVVFLTHAGGLWRDEVNTFNLAAGDSLGGMANDSFPILMPLVVRGWLALGCGGSDTGVRCLGVLIGLGMLAALWLVAWTGRRTAPVLSLALFGLNSTVIIFGDSLRAFGLGSLLVVLVVAAMCAFLRNPSWARAGLLAVIAVLSVQALFQNAIFIASVCIGGLVVCWRRHKWPAAAKILLVALVAAASLFPYYSRIALMSQSSPASGISTLRTEFRPAMVLNSVRSAAGFPLEQYLYVWGLFALALVAFAWVAWRDDSSAPDPSAGEARDLPVFAATTLFTGVAGFAGFLWWAALRTQPWYFLPPMALVAVCIELGLPPLRRYSYSTFLAFVGVTSLVAVPFSWRAAHSRFTNVDLLARRLAAEAAPEDFVLVTPWNRGISFARYFQAQTAWETVPPLEDHSIHRYDLLQRQTQTNNVMRAVFEHVTTTLQTGHRVWVVGTMDIPVARGPVPGDLHPPPLEHTGWSAGPYVRQWTSQAAQFLRNHSRQFVGVQLASTQLINSNEELGLWVAEGWEPAPGLRVAITSHMASCSDALIGPEPGRSGSGR